MLDSVNKNVTCDVPQDGLIGTIRAETIVENRPRSHLILATVETISFCIVNFRPSAARGWTGAISRTFGAATPAVKVGT